MNRYLIATFVPWMLTGMGTLIGAIAVAQLTRVFRGSRTFSPRSLLILLLIIAAGAAIRFFWVPNTHRIYFDEDRYLMYAVTFARFGNALGIQYADPTRHFAGDPDPGARVTVPMIHAWAMRVFGYDDAVLFVTAKIGSTLQILLMAIFTWLVFRRVYTTLVASAMMAFLPITVFWSTTTNLDSFFVFFGLVSGIGVSWYARSPHIRSLLFMLCSITMLLYVRIEGLLFLFPAALLFVVLRKEVSHTVLTSLDRVALGCLIPVLLTRVFVALPLFSQTWCCAEATPLEIFQLGNFWKNTIPNLTTLVVQKEFPLIILLCTLITVFTIRTENFAKKAIFIIWIFVYFMLYSFYYVGIFYSYTFSGSYGRFFLMLVPAFVILAARAVDEWLTQFKTATFARRTPLLLVAVAALVTLYPTVLSYRTMIRISPWDKLVDEGPRLMRAFLTDDLLRVVPANAVIIHPLTGVILMHNRSALSIEAFLFRKDAILYVTQALQKNIPVYILATDVCDATPYKCTNVTQLFDYTPLDIPEQKIKGFSAYILSLKSPTP